MENMKKGKTTLMRVRVETYERLRKLAERSGVNTIDITEHVIAEFLDTIGDEGKVDFYIRRL